MCLLRGRLGLKSLCLGVGLGGGGGGYEWAEWAKCPRWRPSAFFSARLEFLSSWTTHTLFFKLLSGHTTKFANLYRWFPRNTQGLLNNAHNSICSLWNLGTLCAFANLMARCMSFRRWWAIDNWCGYLSFHQWRNGHWCFVVGFCLFFSPLPPSLANQSSGWFLQTVSVIQFPDHHL